MPKIDSNFLSRLKPSKHFKDISGHSYGKLTAEKCLGHDASWQVYWKCTCECGNVLAVRYGNLQSGQAVSCGCGRRKPHTHGMSGTREYVIWVAMRQRCKNVKYHRYAGREITCCPEWESFERFYDDMGKMPEGDYSIERKDNDGPYAPWNCYWATRYDQSRNKTTNYWMEVDGRRMVLQDWCSLTGMCQDTVQDRKRRGWSDKDALTKPTRNGFIPHPIYPSME